MKAPLSWRLPLVVCGLLLAGCTTDEDEDVEIRVDRSTRPADSVAVQPAPPPLPMPVDSLSAEMEIEVPNGGFRLKPGMYSRVDLTVDSRENALTVPINAVRAAVLKAFERTGVQPSEEQTGDDNEIVGTLHKRTVRVTLTAFSDSLTGMTLSVRRNVLVRDRATSSELLEQIEQVLAENPTFAERLRRVRTGGVAAHQ